MGSRCTRPPKRHASPSHGPDAAARLPSRHWPIDRIDFGESEVRGCAVADDDGKMHFRRMDEGTDADFAVLARVHDGNVRKLPDLLLGLLTNLRADEAYPVDRLQHSLQAATRALRDGRDDEYVVCALLHDIGESLGRPSIMARWWPPY